MKKAILIGIGVIALAAIAYFVYKWYQAKKPKADTKPKGTTINYSHGGAQAENSLNQDRN